MSKNISRTEILRKLIDIRKKLEDGMKIKNYQFEEIDVPEVIEEIKKIEKAIWMDKLALLSHDLIFNFLLDQKKREINKKQRADLINQYMVKKICTSKLYWQKWCQRRA